MDYINPYEKIARLEEHVERLEQELAKAEKAYSTVTKQYELTKQELAEVKRLVVRERTARRLRDISVRHYNNWE